MNSYYPASFFAQYSSENSHIPHNVGYSASNNFGLLASRFADQISAYHNSNSFNVDHRGLPNGYPSHHLSQDYHSRDTGGGGTGHTGGGTGTVGTLGQGQNGQSNTSGGGRIPPYPQPAPAHQQSSDDSNIQRSYSSCSTENWSPPPHNGLASHSPESVHTSHSPYSSSLDNTTSNCHMLLQKQMKTDQNLNSSTEPGTPFYPWMGIVGKLYYTTTRSTNS